MNGLGEFSRRLSTLLGSVVTIFLGARGALFGSGHGTGQG